MELDTGYYNEYIASENYNIELTMNWNDNKIDNIKIIVDWFLAIYSNKLFHHYNIFVLFFKIIFEYSEFWNHSLYNILCY